MKFKKYISLNEYKYYEDAWKDFKNDWFKILKNCKSYLKEFESSGSKISLYRGNKYLGKSLVKKDSRLESNRIPSDTPQEVHEISNRIFKKIFGWPVRNGVFATSNQANAIEYGRLWMFFPIGNYKYVWSTKYEDFFEALVKENILIKRGNKGILNPDVQDLEKRLLSMIRTYKTKNLKNAIYSENEIIFNCKSYYLLDKYYFNVIGDLLDNNKKFDDINYIQKIFKEGEYFSGKFDREVGTQDEWI